MSKKDMEFSKKIVSCTGVFSMIQIILTMVLVCLQPLSADSLVSICMTCAAGYMTIFSWYFGKAYGENKLKISSGIENYYTTISNTSTISSCDQETSIDNNG